MQRNFHDEIKTRRIKVSEYEEFKCIIIESADGNRSHTARVNSARKLRINICDT